MFQIPILFIYFTDVYSVIEEEEQEAVDNNKLSERIGNPAVDSDRESSESEVNGHRYSQKHSSSDSRSFSNSNSIISLMAISLSSFILNF